MLMQLVAGHGIIGFVRSLGFRERSIIHMKLPSLRPKKSENVEEVSVGYRPKPTLNKATFLLVFGVLLASASFYEGTAYQRHTDANPSATTASSNFSPNSSSSSQTDSYVRTHILGQVAAVSSSSITVQDETSGQESTLSIGKNTPITANGQTIAATDIQTGDLVVVTKASPTSKAASRIIVTQGMISEGGTNSSATNGSSTTQSDTAGLQPLQSN